MNSDSVKGVTVSKKDRKIDSLERDVVMLTSVNATLQLNAQENENQYLELMAERNRNATEIMRLKAEVVSTQDIVKRQKVTIDDLTSKLYPGDPTPVRQCSKCNAILIDEYGTTSEWARHQLEVCNG